MTNQYQPPAGINKDWTYEQVMPEFEKFLDASGGHTKANTDAAKNYLVSAGFDPSVIDGWYDRWKSPAAPPAPPANNPVATAKNTASADASSAATQSAAVGSTAAPADPGGNTTPVTSNPAITTQEAAELYNEIANQNSAAKPQVEQAVAEDFDPVTMEVDPNQTTSGILNRLLAQDSAYLQQARRYANDEMAGRGLLNSSMAIGAAHDAAIARGADIANSDAQIYANQRLANQEALNTVGMSNADRKYRASEFNAGTINKFSELDYTSKLKLNELRFSSALGKDEMKFAADLDLTKMAKAHGYDLEKMDKGTLADLRKMAVGQGYDLDKMSVDQWNTLERMAKAQGYDLDKIRLGGELDIGKMKLADTLELGRMAKAQGYDLEKMAQAYGYDIGRIREGGEIDMKKLAVAFDYDMDKMVKGAELQMASDAAQRAWQSNEADLGRIFEAGQSELTRDFQKTMQTMQNDFVLAGRKSEFAMTLGNSYMTHIAEVLQNPNLEPEVKASQLDGVWKTMNSTLSMVEKNGGGSFGEFPKFWSAPAT